MNVVCDKDVNVNFVMKLFFYLYSGFTRLPSLKYEALKSGYVVAPIPVHCLTATNCKMLPKVYPIDRKALKKKVIECLGSFAPTEDEVSLVLYVHKPDGRALCKVVVTMPTYLAGSTQSGRNPERTPMRCLCGGPSTKVCSRCRLGWYCSPECQRVDWPVHRKTCKCDYLTQQALA